MMDRPKFLAIALWLCFTGFVLLRLAAHHGEPSTFICAGTPLCNPTATPTSLHVLTNGASYDGQFYYRMALNPANLKPTAYGISMDVPAYRQMRIGYPLVCWLFSLGQADWLPLAMIGVNLFWLAVLMTIGMHWSRDLGFAPAWGLLPLLWPGFLMTLGRDLTEIQAVTLLVSGTWLAERQKPGLAALAFSGAVLTRETMVLPLLGFGLYWLGLGYIQRSWTSCRRAIWLLVPAVVLLIWHGYLRWHHGVWPVLSGSVRESTISAMPFSGLLTFIGAGLPFNPLHLPALVKCLTAERMEFFYQGYAMSLLILCAGIALLSAMALYSTVAPGSVKTGWALLTLLLFAQTQANWALGPSAFLRLGNDAAVFGLFLIAFNGSNLKRYTAWLMACGWLAVWPYCITMP